MVSCRCIQGSLVSRQLFVILRNPVFSSQAGRVRLLSGPACQISFIQGSKYSSRLLQNCCQRKFQLSLKTPVVSRSISSSSRLLDELIVHTPPFADSVTEGDIRWDKAVGDTVAEDEVVAEIETDKTAIPVTSPAAGILEELFVEDGGKVEKGDKLFRIETGEGVAAQPKSESTEEAKPEPVATPPPPPPPPPPRTSTPQAPPTQPPPVPMVPSSPLKVTRPTAPPPPPISQQPKQRPAKESKEAPTQLTGTRTETKVKISRMRQRIAQRLKEAQNINAMLTTFNELDMTNVMEMRKLHKDAFLKKHNVKLGFMSAFIKASSYALQSMPTVNAVIEDGFTVYRDYVDISVAVSTPKGLVVPVLRNAHAMNYADIEKGINELGEKARTGALAIEDMDGGTFTISNGGVFGSLMGTPIINPPQSAILGMHAIVDRPVAINGKVEIRPMMYLALTYDHRLIDGREAVTFLKKIKSAVEDPRVLVLDL